MPWTCGECDTADISDAAGVCPTCGDRKLAWTVKEGQTRRFQVARGARDKVELLTGDGQAAGEVTSIPRAGAEERARARREPDPEHVLVVRLTAAAGADLSVRVVALHACSEPREVVVPGPERVEASGPRDVRLVFVHGRGTDDAAPTFPGLHVIDVTEEDVEGGHAPAVSVAALKRKARELPVRAFARRPAAGPLRGAVWHKARFAGHTFTDRDEDPVELDFRAQHVDVKVLSAPPGATLTPRLTDRRGAFDFGEVPAGAYRLELTVDGARAEHEVVVPLPEDAGAEGARLWLPAPRPSPREENLKAGQELSPVIARELTSFNQWTPAAVFSWLVPTELAKIVSLSVEMWFAGGEADPQDLPAEVVQLPGPNYAAFKRWMRSARGKGLGNCSEKAAYAAVACAGRGLHPVEMFALQKADHAFCVVGRDPGSRLDDPGTWGRDAVIIDPWLEEVYPATQIGWHLQRFKDVHEGLPAPPTQLGGLIRF